MKKEYAVFITTMISGFSVHAKRLAPKPVAPVAHAGLRYEVPNWVDESKGIKHNGGYVRVVNTRDGLPICTKEVYEVKYDRTLEMDVQDNFITTLKIEGNNVIITSERLPPIKRPIANFCD